MSSSSLLGFKDGVLNPSSIIDETGSSGLETEVITKTTTGIRWALPANPGNRGVGAFNYTVNPTVTVNNLLIPNGEVVTFYTTQFQPGTYLAVLNINVFGLGDYMTDSYVQIVLGGTVISNRDLNTTSVNLVSYNNTTTAIFTVTEADTVLELQVQANVSGGDLQSELIANGKIDNVVQTFSTIQFN